MSPRLPRSTSRPVVRLCRITSVPRGPAGVVAAGPPAGAARPPASAAAPPRPAPPPAGVAGLRFRIRYVALAENENVWMSCHDFTAPVARLRSSTRVGSGGRLALAPRAPGPAPWAAGPEPVGGIAGAWTPGAGADAGAGCSAV